MKSLQLSRIALAMSGIGLNCGADARGSVPADTNTDSCEETSDVLVSQLLRWLGDNGAYINEKATVRRAVPDDPSSTYGIFATGAMDAGETLCRIPWHLILKPEGGEAWRASYSDCGTIDAVRRAMMVGGDEATPYGRYLLAQPAGYTAGFWSQAAKDLVGEMLRTERTEHLTVSDELPPRGVGSFLEDYLTDECHADLDDPLYLHAAILVKARADYDLMTPFYDMTNHHNGKANLAHRYDPYKDDIVRTGYEIVTTKAVEPDEELFLSYNRCNSCGAYFDWFGTPEMWLHYGFVESLPQRWLFDFARVKFDLDWKDSDESTGEVIVKFLVPPSELGIGLLREELARLESFSAAHRSMDYGASGILESEWESLWQYYDALRDALSYAVESNAPLTNEVWNRDDDWWVKDGKFNAADEDEHWVFPTVNAKL